MIGVSGSDLGGAVDKDGNTSVELVGLSKIYGETKALTDLTLNITGGEVHALMGENGSGKSTLVKLVSGIVSPSNGKILLDGQEVAFTGPADAIKCGIGTIHQDSMLVPELTVAQNILLGHEKRLMPGFLASGSRAVAKHWLDAIRADISPDTPAGALSIAGKQLVAIAKALSNESRLIFFDEPTAALGDAETEHLLAQIDALRAQGIAVVYISHRIAEVRRIADRITVLKDGNLVYTGTDNLDEREIIRLMIGREPDALFPVLASPKEDVLVDAQNITSADGLLEIEKFLVRSGEVVGLAGLDGSGRDILARILGGVESPAAGLITLDGKLTKRSSPSSAVRAGITFVPPDRRRQAIIDNFSIARTMTQSAVWKFLRAGFIRLRDELSRAYQIGKSLGVKSENFTNGILTLSGGNQQKAVLARALVAESSLLVCDEPTAGVDVGSRADIYGQFAALAKDGMGIVLSSSDMVELMGMCHRIVVIREGRISAEFSASVATEESLLAAQLPIEEISALN